MGLQDTLLALQWLQNNILFFGGDPTRVTGIIPFNFMLTAQSLENPVVGK